MKKLFTFFALVLCSAKLPAYDFMINGICYNISGSNVYVTYYNTQDTYQQSRVLGDITIPEEVTNKGITYPVVGIGERAFRFCTGLTSVILPNTITYIRNEAFIACSNLTSINIPNSVTSIDNYAFSSCSKLTSVIIPNSVISIGDNAFSHCSKLVSITLPEGITNISQQAFSDCGLEGTFIIPNSVTTLGIGALSNCSKLSHIVVGTGVEYIPQSCFSNAAKVRSITLLGDVKEIGDYAFGGCSGLLSLSIAATEPPFILSATYPNKTFLDVSTTLALSVPCGSVDLYKAAQYWGLFTNYVEGSPYTLTVRAENKLHGKVVVTQQPDCESDGVAIFEAVPYPGYKFVKWNDNNTNNPRIVELTADAEYVAIFEPTNKVTSVSLNKTSLELTIGASEQLTAIVLPDNATNKTVTWSTSNDNVRVENGLVTALAVGTSTITVTTEDGSKTATCSVNIRNVINVTTDSNLSDVLEGAEEGSEIVVTDGAKLTCDADATVGNILVDAGSILEVIDATLTIKQILTARSKQDVQPQIITTGTGTITYSTFRFLKSIPADRCYFFSLPFACATSSVTIDGATAVYNTDWNIRYYDGAGYAATASNDNFWLVDETNIMEANKGYSIGVAAPTTSIYRELAFATTEAVDFSITATKTLPVAANKVASGVSQIYQGWNFVKNPYTSNYNADKGTLKIPGTFFSYVTIPDPGQNKTYTSKLFSELDALEPFFGFFVQTAAEGDVTFTPKAKQAAPALLDESAESEPLVVTVSLSNGIKADETSLVIDNQFSEEYEIGADLSKMVGYADKPQIYTYDATTKYAFQALPVASAAKQLPMGVYLPATGEYTLSLSAISADKEAYAVYLYDYELNQRINLAQGDYIISSQSDNLNTETRFAISVDVAPNTSTDLHAETANAFVVRQDGSLQVRVQGVEAGDRVRIFDVQGRIVCEWTATAETTTGNVPHSGLYIVETTNTTTVRMAKLVIN